MSFLVRLSPYLADRELISIKDAQRSELSAIFLSSELLTNDTNKAEFLVAYKGYFGFILIFNIPLTPLTPRTAMTAFVIFRFSRIGGAHAAALSH
jgi:hypothetical protein